MARPETSRDRARSTRKDCKNKRPRKKTKALQLTFDMLGRGGAREGAGRKPTGEQAGVSHAPRQPFAARFPAHVTMKLSTGLPSLRRRREHRAILGALTAGKERGGFRLVQYSIQSNHMHAIVEGANRAALGRGMHALTIRIARALNRTWGRKGRVFADRYHCRILRTPLEVKRALEYVLKNCMRHGLFPPRTAAPDPFSSGRWFDGWRGHRTHTSSWDDLPVARARTWLLTTGWRRHGLIDPMTAPGKA